METEGCACLPHGHYVKHLLYATDVDVDGEATDKWTLVHCLSNLHNFIETYGENKALNGKKNYPGACAPGNFNVASPLEGRPQWKFLSLYMHCTYTLGLFLLDV